MPDQQPNQQDPVSNVLQKYGSLTNFYRQIAHQTGSTPDKVMEETEKMAGIAQNPNQPQNTLGGANAQTPVSQVANTTPPANPASVQAQSQQLQAGGMGQSQAMNQAATNPQNQMGMAKGGEATKKPKHKPVSPPSTPMPQGAAPSSSQVKDAVTAMGGDAMRALTPSPGQPPQIDPNSFAKGGAVHPQMGELKLKDILQLLASHPGVSGTPSPSAQAGSSGFAGGGPVFQNSVSSEPDAHYAKGGLMGMASGGSTQEEEDQITGYGPDGQPIVQNPDGSVGYGDLNQLLDRPENSSTIGTGADPNNSVSQNAANTPLMGMAMSKGGADEAPPPGSLSHEIADDIPANLSEGEFVFSADSTRFYGLQKLHAMQDFAREQLAHLENSGGIRSPGDGKNAPGFQGDSQPNQNFYGNDQGDESQEGDEDKDGMAKGGNVKDCNGGLMYRAGGDVNVNEDDSPESEAEIEPGKGLVNMARGGKVQMQDRRFATNEQGGSTAQDYKRGGPVRKPQYLNKGGIASKKRPPQKLDKGGVVTSKSDNLAPDRMKSVSAVPTNSLKLSPKSMGPTQRVNGPHVNVASYGSKKFQLGAKKGGLMRSVNNPFTVNG